MKTKLPTLLLVSVLALQGCGSIGTVNGTPVDNSRAIAGAIVGILVVGGLIALAANMDDEPDATIVTRGPNGTYTTEVYR